MNQGTALIALAILDGLLTAAERIAQHVAKAKLEGLVTVAEQEERMARVDALRELVGLTKP
jgi:hypothetical protein